jgi:hypothetical protein
MLGRWRDFLLAIFIAVGFVAAGGNAGKPPLAKEPSKSGDAAMSSSIDALFQRYRQTLPEPETLSEQNGAGPRKSRMCGSLHVDN